MADLVKLAFYQMAGNFLLFFLVLPAALIALGYLVFIVVQIIKELKEQRR